MYKYISVFSCPLFLAFCFFGCMNKKGELVVIKKDCATLNVTYSATIQPIINTECAISGCHVSGGTAPTDYATYAGIKISIDPGFLKDRTLTQKDMPPAGALADTTLQKISCWLDAGAPNN